MINLNPFAISGLLIAITDLPLLILILKVGNNKIARLYAFSLLAVLIWGLGAFLIGITKNSVLAALYLKFAYSGALFIPVLTAHTVLLLVQKKSRFIIFFLYAQAVFFLTVNWTCDKPYIKEV